jgi:hypothetical protein
MSVIQQAVCLAHSGVQLNITQLSSVSVFARNDIRIIHNPITFSEEKSS